MSFRDEVTSGRHDAMLIDTARRDRIALDDPFLRAEGTAMARAVLEGRVDPSAMFEAATLREAILSGPGGSDPIAGIGTSQSTAIAAEDAGWIRAGAGEGLAAAAFAPSSREQMVRYLYWLVAHNPIARNIIGHYVNLTIGEGFKIVFKTEKQRKRWKEIERRVGWRRRLRKIVKHTYLLGEWFTVMLPLSGTVTKDAKGKLTTSSELEDERSEEASDLRGFGPEQIERVICQGDKDYDPASPEDAETVLAYARPGDKAFLSPQDVLHHMWDDNGNMTRGVPVLYPVLRYLRLFEKFVENRHWLNHMRSRIPLIRKVAGGPQHVTAEKNRNATLPPPGTLITENMATSYEFPALQLEAEDARHDGRTLIEVVAAGVSLPVYFVISNPSDTNYASLMASDSPVIAMFEGLQEDIWIPDISKLVSALTGEDADQFCIYAGAVMKRNQKSIADTVGPMIDRKVISRRTARTWFDLDPDEEQLNVEGEEGMDAGLGASGGSYDDGEDVIPKKEGRPARSENPGDDGNGGRRPRPSA